MRQGCEINSQLFQAFGEKIVFPPQPTPKQEQAHRGIVQVHRPSGKPAAGKLFHDFDDRADASPLIKIDSFEHDYSSGCFTEAATFCREPIGGTSENKPQSMLAPCMTGPMEFAQA